MKVPMSMMISDWWGWWGFCSSERWVGELIAGVSCADLELPTLAQPVFIFPIMMMLTNNNSLPTLPILRFYKSVSLRTHLMSFLDILMLIFNTYMGRDFQSLSLSSEIDIWNVVSKKNAFSFKRAASTDLLKKTWTSPSSCSSPCSPPAWWAWGSLSPSPVFHSRDSLWRFVCKYITRLLRTVTMMTGRGK